MQDLIVSPSPHIRHRDSTRSIMLDVVIALIPAVIASGILFGWRAIVLIFVCTASSFLSEYIYQKLCKRAITVGDLSAVVTGVLLGLNLPVATPIWQAVFGSVVAIVVVKQLFGGIGCNFANPAITARIVMFLSFSKTMATYDAVSSATPLAQINNGGALPSLSEMFLGMHGGSVGETCTLALLLGAIYLICRKVITWHTPVVYIATVFVLTLALGEPALYHILSGGLVLGAFFMATDYVTTPSTPWGKVIFGLGCGVITVLIRVYGNYPEGVSFAILFMNILTPYINIWTRRRHFGGVKKI